MLFLYGNRPEPLPVHMMRLLADTGGYCVELLYYDRADSVVSLPLSGLADPNSCFPITWPVGKSTLAKIVNRGVVLTKFVRETRARKPDVIHAWNLDMLLAARVAAAGLAHTNIVFTLQDTTQWMLSPIANTVQRWAYRGVDLLFVTSCGFESGFLRRFRLVPPERKVVFVPNVPPDQQFASFEPRHGQGEFTVGYIGLLRGQEGITALFEATRLARQRGANVRLLFAGKGPQGDLVQRLASENGFVDYLGPYQHDRDIVGIYSQVDAVYGIYDASYDKKIHLAYRLCEAVNCCLPIIVAKGTHMAEVVEQHRIGLSVRLGDVEELAQTLVTLYESPAARMEIAAHCEQVRPQFVLEHYHDRIRAAYREL